MKKDWKVGDKFYFLEDGGVRGDFVASVVKNSLYGHGHIKSVGGIHKLFENIFETKEGCLAANIKRYEGSLQAVEEDYEATKAWYEERKAILEAELKRIKGEVHE